MTNPVTFFTVNEKTAFVPLRYVYPECEKLIKDHSQLFPLWCLKNEGCPANMQCMELLCKRVNYLFTMVIPNVDMIVAYYKYPDRPKSIRAGIFRKDLDEPFLMTLNPWGFRKFQKDGVAFTWIPTPEYLNIGASRNIIPVHKLIR